MASPTTEMGKMGGIGWWEKARISALAMLSLRFLLDTQAGLAVRQLDI